MEYNCYYESPIGTILLTSDGTYLTGLWFTTTRFINLRDAKEIKEDLRVFILTKDWLNRYFAGGTPDPREIPTHMLGTTFSKKVWEILKTIPYGKTITYGEIAKIIGQEENRKMSSQAVGHAVGHNPISIIIPCHRVVGANGNLTGYGSGLDIKIKLLELEKVDMEKYYKPKKGNAL